MMPANAKRRARRLKAGITRVPQPSRSINPGFHPAPTAKRFAQQVYMKLYTADGQPVRLVMPGAGCGPGVTAVGYGGGGGAAGAGIPVRVSGHVPNGWAWPTPGSSQ